MTGIFVGDVFGSMGSPGATEVLRHILVEQLEDNLGLLAITADEKKKFGDSSYWETMLGEQGKLRVLLGGDAEGSSVLRSLDDILKSAQDDAFLMASWKEHYEEQHAEHEVAFRDIVSMLEWLLEERYVAVIERLLARAREIREHYTRVMSLPMMANTPQAAQLLGNAEVCELLARMLICEHKLSKHFDKSRGSPA